MATPKQHSPGVFCPDSKAQPRSLVSANSASSACLSVTVSGVRATSVAGSNASTSAVLRAASSAYPCAGGVYWQPPADAGHHAQVMLRLPAGEIYDVGAVELDKVNGLVELPLQPGQQRGRRPHHWVVV